MCSAHGDCKIKVKLNHKISVIFHNLKSYYLHLIIQEQGNFDFKIKTTPNGLQGHMSFNINNKLIFTDSFQSLSLSLDSLVKNLTKDHFKCLNQEFDSKVSDSIT